MRNILLPSLLLVYSCASFSADRPTGESTGKPFVTRLSFGRSGRITWLGVNVGDRVRPNQRLAALDCTEAKTQLEVAEGELALHRSKASQRRKATDPVDLDIARKRLELAELDLRIAESRQKRFDSLRQRDGFISYQDLENADRVLAAARLGVTLAQQSVGKLEQPPPPEEQRELDVEEKIRVARVTEAAYQTSLCEITSPIDGTVSAIHYSLGEGVQALERVIEVGAAIDRDK